LARDRSYAIGPNRKTAVVEVKASNSSRFVTGFFQRYKDEAQEHPDFWVLYRWAGDLEQFFVLTHDEMAIAQAGRNQPGREFSWARSAQRATRGVDNVLAADIQEHLAAWHKIDRWCKA
jgi:hypothetical protein